MKWEHVQPPGNSKNENGNTQRRRDVMALTKRVGPWPVSVPISHYPFRPYDECRYRAIVDERFQLCVCGTLCITSTYGIVRTYLLRYYGTT